MTGVAAVNTTKFDTGLFEVTRAVRAVAERGWGLNAVATQAVSAQVSALVASKQARFTGNSVQVTIEWASPAARDASAVRGAGGAVEIEDAARGLTQASVPIATLDRIEALPGVRRVRLPNYPVHAVGSQLTEGDALLRFSNLRAAAGVDGTGITVGVISDGILGLQTAIGLSDLPASAETRTSGVLTATSGGVIAQSFRSDGNLEAGSEGTAMLEIVHDIAPGAQLRFANFNTDLEFNAAVNFLASVSDIVVDDIGWLGMPADGTSIVSTNTSAALNNAANPIRGYYTSIGNQALRHYRDPYLGTAAVICDPADPVTTADITTRAVGTTAGLVPFSGNMTWFRATANTSNQGSSCANSINNAIRVANGVTVTVELMWDDTWGASSNDYNLAVTWTGGGFYNLAGSSTFVQNGNDDPLERVTFTNTTGATQIFDIRVWKQGNVGADKTLNIMVSGAISTVTDFTSSNMLWLTTAGSLLAQSDAGGGVVSVGAINAIDADWDTIAGYSSNGPTHDGRTKPDVTAIDGVSVTGAGGFLTPPEKFYGTSAAAPHVAALAALLVDRHPTLQDAAPSALSAASARTTLRSLITGSTVDLGTAGIDNVYGYGRVDGLLALVAAASPTQLAFTATPPLGVTGSIAPAPVPQRVFTVAPTVEVRDVLGTTVSSATTAVTLSIKSGTGAPGAVLAGVTTVNAVNGVATFPGLSINLPGSGYVLVATASGLTEAEGAPFDVTLGLAATAYTSIGAGLDHTCAIAGTGGVACWGNNNSGETGNGTSGDLTSLPSPVVDLTSGVASVALGGAFSCALTTTGGVKCWGNNSTGQLGRGTTTDFEEFPDDVTGLTSGVAAIGAGLYHACAVTTLGAVKCWGSNTSGQLGDGNSGTESNVPVDVSGAGSGFATVAGGAQHTCGLTTGGGVKCWGSRASGQVGDGTGGSPALTPVDANGLTSGVAAISTGSAHSCAVTTAGAATCWGADTSSQLGDDAQMSTGVAAIAAGSDFTCLLTTTGGVKCWGGNTYGQLGRGTTGGAATATPADVTGLTSGVTSLAAGALHACAVQSGTVNCWGDGSLYKLGNNDTVAAPTPVTLYQPSMRLVVTTQPAGATAGAAFGTQPVIAVADLDGNTLTGATGTVSIAIKSGTGPAGGALAGTATASIVSGVATFTDLRIDRAGAGYSLTATSSGVTSVDTSAFAVSAGSASALVFATAPAGAVTGAAGSPVPAAIFSTQPVVQVQDGFGNLVSSAGNSITLSIKGGTGTLGAALTGTNPKSAVNGVAAFTDLRIDRPGTGYILVAAASGLTSGESAAFNVTQGAAHHVGVATQPAGATGGTAFGTQPVFEIRDGDENLIAGSSATVTVTIKPATGTVGAELTGTTSIAAVGGVATFTNLKIDRIGTGYVLVAASSGLTSVETAPFDVIAGAPVIIEFSTVPAGAVTGAVGVAVPQAIFTTQPTVRLLDAGGNVADGATNAVTLSIKSGTGTLGASLSGTNPKNAIAGVATFTDLRIDRPGTGYVLTAAVAGLTSVDSAAFNVTQGSAAALSVAVQPAGAVAGAAFTTQPVVHVLDGDGNVVTGSSATITAVIRGGTGAFGATLAGTRSVAAVSGVATFDDLRIDQASTGYQLTFYVNGLVVHSAAFNVAAGDASKLVIARQPSGGIAGAALTGQPIVRVTDAVGNVIAGAGTPITFTIVPATGAALAALSGTNVVNTDGSGVATFTDLSIDLAGSGYVLRAASPGLTSADSSAFAVRTSAVAIQTLLVSTAGGAPFATQPVVTLRNASGVLSTTDPVTASIKPGTGTPGATLLGTTTVNAVNGVATFTDLSIDKAGTGYVIVLSSFGSSISNAFAPDVVRAAVAVEHAAVETPPFDVAVGAATGIAFLTSPGGTTPGALFTPQPAVAIRDAGGNTVLTATDTVTLAITGGTGTVGATLAGTTGMAAVNGVATFFDLTIATAGTSYTLTASATGLGTAASSAFSMAVPAVVTPPAVSSGGGGGGGGGGAASGPPMTVSPGGGTVATLADASAELDLGRPSVVNATIAAVAPGSTEAVTSTARLSIPAAAMPGIAVVVVRPVASVAELAAIAPEPAGQTLITAVLLGSFGSSDEPIEIKQFDHPVELTITVPGAALPEGEDGSKLVIAYWDGTAWSDLATTARRDGTSIILTTALSHFSTYGVMYNGGGPRPVASVGSGTFSAPPIFSPGGQAFVVYGGGSSAQLEASAGAAGATGVWAQDAGGTFRLLVVRGPEFLRREFDAAFPAGFTGTTAMTLVR